MLIFEELYKNTFLLIHMITTGMQLPAMVDKIIYIFQSVGWHNRCRLASLLLAKCPSSYSRLPI